MSCTVFAENMGLFHKGSDGKGIAPGDVCLSPPPPPTGPAPVPYVNSLSASDLAEGSKTVKIQGEPTALEDHSYVSTSTGDEGGTQGGNVVTHKTKGKGYFKLWSFTVQIEGKGVARHGDIMGQNCTSDPPGCVDVEALVEFAQLDWVDSTQPCPDDSYVRPTSPRCPSPAQTNHVNSSPPIVCWQCPTVIQAGGATADHQPPMVVAWYMGGCHDPEKFREWAYSNEAVKSHCSVCSNSQGGSMGGLSGGMNAMQWQQRILSWMPSGQPLPGAGLLF